RRSLPEDELSGLRRRAEALALGPGGLLRAEAGRPFDPARGPLWGGVLIRPGGAGHPLLRTLHHTASAGGSAGILLAAVTAPCRAVSAGLPSPLRELPLQYGDFAAWQREWMEGEALERQLAFWKSRLAGAPELLELPSDRPRPAVASSAGALQE